MISSDLLRIADVLYLIIFRCGRLPGNRLPRCPIVKISTHSHLVFFWKTKGPDRSILCRSPRLIGYFVNHVAQIHVTFIFPSLVSARERWKYLHILNRSTMQVALQTQTSVSGENDRKLLCVYGLVRQSATFRLSGERSSVNGVR